ncbi:MAG: ATP-binding protein [Candidatus Omnitrophota bacterium]
MTRIEELWTALEFISNPGGLDETTLRHLLPVLEEELNARKVRRIGYLLKRSGIKRIKRLADFDWKASPGLPREKFMTFANTSWVKEIRNLVLIGPAGVGKTHLATGLCYEAIQKGIPVTSITCFDLIGKLKNARNRHALIQYYSSVKVLCLDELGYVFPSQDEANGIFQIISKRAEIAPTLVTTNLVPSQWGKIFEPATATAILDRLSLKGTFLALEGKSYRSGE